VTGMRSAAITIKPFVSTAVVGVYYFAFQVIVQVGMLLSAPFWWGFDLPFAWLSAALVLPTLAAAWTVYRKASRHPGESRRSSA